MSALLINLLRNEHVDWDAFKLQLLSCKKHKDTACMSMVLLAVVKKSNVPLEIIRHLAPLVKLKTLKNVFECNCSIEVKEAVLDEMDLTTSLAESLISKAIQCNNLEAIQLIQQRNSIFLSKDFYRGAFREYEVFDKMCKVLISHDLLHEDLVLGSQMLHAAAFHGHTEMVNLIQSRFPETLSQMDKYGNLPLHYACENQNIDAAVILLRGGLEMVGEDLKVCHIGGLLVRNKSQKSALRLLCGSGADGNRVKLAVFLVNTVDLPRNKRFTFPDVVKEVDLCHLVARHGDLASMKILMRETPYCVRWKNQLGEKPISIACKYGHFDLAIFMYNVAIEQRGINHNQLLKEAINVELEEGVNPDLFVPFVMQTVVDSCQLHECLLLHHVASKGTARHATLLVKLCPRLLMMRDCNGSLPIHLACRDLNIDVIRNLLYGARDDKTFHFRYGGLLTRDYKGDTAIKYLLVAFNDVDEDIFHASKCIETCIDIFPDLPVLQHILYDSILEASMVEEFIRIFNPNPTIEWIEDKTALLVAIDAYNQCPSENTMQVLGAILSHDRSYRSINHITKRNGRNPLHYSVDLGLKWDPVIKMLVKEDYLSLLETDLDANCILPFMLAASSRKCNLDLLFCLLRTEPSCLERIQNN